MNMHSHTHSHAEYHIAITLSYRNVHVFAASAVFLHSCDHVTAWQAAHPSQFIDVAVWFWEQNLYSRQEVPQLCTDQWWRLCDWQLGQLVALCRAGRWSGGLQALQLHSINTRERRKASVCIPLADPTRGRTWLRFICEIYLTDRINIKERLSHTKIILKA